MHQMDLNKSENKQLFDVYLFSRQLDDVGYYFPRIQILYEPSGKENICVSREIIPDIVQLSR